VPEPAELEELPALTPKPVRSRVVQASCLPEINPKQRSCTHENAVTDQPAPAETQPDEAGVAAYAVRDVAGSTVEGRVLFQGPAPPPKRVQVTQDAEFCGRQREVYSLRMRDSGVDEAVVWIENIQQGKSFAFPPPLLNQKGCEYLPHVSVMAPGEIEITSEDPIPHNIHTYAQNNREYNESMNTLRPKISLRFPRPDIISVRCDLHGWMQGYVVVAKNPYYAITSQGGRFRLENVPPGQYRLKVWSESMGESEQEQEIVVEAGKVTRADFTLQSPTAATGGGK